jgi:uncharacterized integral membrane protein
MTNPRPASNTPQPIATIVLIAIVILSIPLVIQNWEPAIAIVFLGQKIYAVPFSLAMLAALISGGIVAFLINLIFRSKFEPIKKVGSSSAQIPKASSRDSRYDDDFDELEDD